jgi:hypothetical protein
MERNLARLRAAHLHPHPRIERADKIPVADAVCKGTDPAKSMGADPNLTLTRTQHAAIMGKAGNRKPYSYAVFAYPCNAQQPLTANS